MYNTPSYGYLPEDLAGTGDADSQYALGLKYELGWDCDINLDIAEEWYTKASRLGHGASMFRLCYLRSNAAGGFPDNETSAWVRKLLARAARLGYGPAAYELSLIYQFGSPGEVNKRSSNYWLKKAAELGHPPGRLDYADHLCLEGPTKAKREKARILYQELARAGDVDAKCRLGILMLRHGERKSYRRGFKLLKCAADAGHPAANIELGWIYGRGEFGVRQDQELADRYMDRGERSESDIDTT